MFDYKLTEDPYTDNLNVSNQTQVNTLQIELNI